MRLGKTPFRCAAEGLSALTLTSLATSSAALPRRTSGVLLSLFRSVLASESIGGSSYDLALASLQKCERRGPSTGSAPRLLHRRDDAMH